jgi:hypothetical protein
LFGWVKNQNNESRISAGAMKMSTKLAVYIGCGEHNIGGVSAFAGANYADEPIGTKTGDKGFERIRVADSIAGLIAVMTVIDLMLEKPSAHEESETLEIISKFKPEAA